MKRVLEHPLDALRATGAVLRASARVAWHEPRHDLEELIGKLRTTPRSCRRPLAPGVVDGVLERLLAWLPPWRLGRCVKRSLILLDLRSRDGLAPSFHLGFLAGTQPPRGHAWVSSPADTPAPSGVIETFRG